MKKRTTLVLASALLFGCGGNVDISGSSTAGSGGSGGTTTTTGSTSSSQGGTTSQGGSGGALLGGTGGGTTTNTQQGCSVVLDKGWFVDFDIDGGPTMEYTDPCSGWADGMGPYAAMFHGKGGPGIFEIIACPPGGAPMPTLSLSTPDPTVPNGPTTISFTDAGGVNMFTDGGVSTFTTWGPEWTSVAGTFNGKIAAADGSVKVVNGNFLVCRRPDLYAP